MSLFVKGDFAPGVARVCERPREWDAEARDCEADSPVALSSEAVGMATVVFAEGKPCVESLLLGARRVGAALSTAKVGLGDAFAEGEALPLAAVFELLLPMVDLGQCQQKTDECKFNRWQAKQSIFYTKSFGGGFCGSVRRWHLKSP